MPAELSVKYQIHQTIDALPAEQLPDLLRLLQQFIAAVKPEETAAAAPVYGLHHHAAETGVADLAAQHDHYLYGTARRDA